jgi:hypothetical protein
MALVKLARSLKVLPHEQRAILGPSRWASQHSPFAPLMVVSAPRPWPKAHWPREATTSRLYDQYRLAALGPGHEPHHVLPDLPAPDEAHHAEIKTEQVDVSLAVANRECSVTTSRAPQGTASSSFHLFRHRRPLFSLCCETGGSPLRLIFKQIITRAKEDSHLLSQSLNCALREHPPHLPLELPAQGQALLDAAPQPLKHWGELLQHSLFVLPVFDVTENVTLAPLKERCTFSTSKPFHLPLEGAVIVGHDEQGAKVQFMCNVLLKSLFPSLAQLKVGGGCELTYHPPELHWANPYVQFGVIFLGVYFFLNFRFPTLKPEVGFYKKMATPTPWGATIAFSKDIG